LINGISHADDAGVLYEFDTAYQPVGCSIEIKVAPVGPSGIPQRLGYPFARTSAHKGITRPRPINLLRWRSSGGRVQALDHELLLGSALKLLCSSLLLALQQVTFFLVRAGLSCIGRCNIAGHGRQARQQASAKD
jgi:hypothetical protein